MKIAFLTPEYPHPQLGHTAGIGSSIKNLTHALVDKGDQITIFVYSQAKNAVFIEEGIEIHAIVHQKYQIGGGAVVIKNIETSGLYVGNPVKFIR